MAREPGFYWLRHLEQRRGPNPTAAYWDGESWSFIGSLYLVGEDEYDDPEASDRQLIMARYEIGERITEPSI